MQKSFMLAAFAGAAIFTAFIGISIGLSYHIYDPDLIPLTYEYRDAWHMAVQLGRLDVISALLAMLGILIGLFALIGFGYIRVRSEVVAREEACKVARKVALEEAAKAVKEWRENVLPRLVISKMEDWDELSSGTTDEVANDIASSAGDNNSKGK